MTNLRKKSLQVDSPIADSRTHFANTKKQPPSLRNSLNSKPRDGPKGLSYKFKTFGPRLKYSDHRNHD